MKVKRELVVNKIIKKNGVFTCKRGLKYIGMCKEKRKLRSLIDCKFLAVCMSNVELCM